MSVYFGNKFYRSTINGFSNKIEGDKFELIFKDQLKVYEGLRDGMENIFHFQVQVLKVKRLFLKLKVQNKLKKKADAIIQLILMDYFRKNLLKVITINLIMNYN